MADANLNPKATEAVQSLPIGTALSNDQFTITEHLGAGGFGITYRAKDNVLGRTVVIKECYYEDFCIRSGKSVVARSKTYAKPIRSIVDMFMREARSLAKLRHPNIVGVHRAFEENDTAYMVLDLIDGRDMFDIIASPVSPARVKDILVQLLDAIEKVHEVDLLHRDISPDNILIEKSGTPVLIDFGAARAEASRHTRAISSLLVVKDGYSPHEFYVTGSEQTPSSDLYALAATFYHVLSGEAAPNSQSRMVEIAGRKPDPCVPLVGRINGYDQEFLQAIDTAMQIHPSDRIQTAAKWKSLIADTGADATHLHARVSSKDVSLELERSLSRLVEETNDEVRRTSQQPVAPKTIITFSEQPKKLEWIEEFNLESLVPAPKPLIALENIDLVQDTPFDEPEPLDDLHEPPSHQRSKSPTNSETKWVERALEKQERIKSERESALEVLKEASVVPPPSQNPFETADDLMAATEKANSLHKLRSSRIVAGLLVCFSLVFFLDIP